jgi:hypothetical protein
MKRLLWLCALAMVANLYAQPRMQWLQTVRLNNDTTVTEFDYSGAIVQTADGGYCVGGSTVHEPAVDGDGALLIRLNPSGDTLWTRTFGTTGDSFNCILELPGGGFLAGGPGGTPIVKCDSDGHPLWTRGHLPCDAILPMADGGFVLGQTDSLIKINSEGDTVWTRTFLPPPRRDFVRMMYSEDPGFGGVLRTTDGGFLMFGALIATEDLWGPCAGYVAKTDSNGELLWSRVYNDSALYCGFFRGRATGDGGAILAGRWNPQWGTSGYSTWIVRLDSDGDTLWTHLGPDCYPYGDPLAVGDIEISWDGGFILAASAMDALGEGYLVLTKFSAGGDSLWTDACFLVHGSLALGTPKIVSTADSGYVCTALMMDWAPEANPTYIQVVKVGPDLPNDVASISQSASDYQLLGNYPNPFNPQTNISFDLPQTDRVTLNVFDVTGRCVARLADGIVPAGHHTIAFDGSSLASGMYFYRLDAGEFRDTRKMILLK